MKLLLLLLAAVHTSCCTAFTKRDTTHSKQTRTLKSLHKQTPLASMVASIFPAPVGSFETWQPLSGLRNDIRRRAPHYKSDWMDGFRKRTLGASLFLYFACLAPVVAFGGISNLITEGSIGVIEFVISSGMAGIIYAVFAGQPMTFVGPTGLTLAFIATLYRFSLSNGLPFLEIYSWTGIWTSLFLALSAVLNLSNLLKYCTRFTDDTFNALLSVNFLYEAALSLSRNFMGSSPNLLKALVSLNVATCTGNMKR